MNKNIKIRTVLAFLKQKGWKVLRQTHRFNVLEAPSKFKFEPDPYFSIPLEDRENSNNDYNIFMEGFIELISDLYEIEKNELIQLWSKSIEEIQAEIIEKQELLTFA